MNGWKVTSIALAAVLAGVLGAAAVVGRALAYPDCGQRV